MHSRPTRLIPTIAWLVTLSGAQLAGCGGDDVYIVFERFELRDDERIPQGSGCVSVLQRRGGFAGGSVSSGSGSSSADLMVEQGDRGDRYEVVVSSFGDVLAHRSYDEKFLRSHELDRFEVTTQLGKRFEFSYQGSRECSSPPNLEGDPDPG